MIPDFDDWIGNISQQDVIGNINEWLEDRRIGYTDVIEYCQREQYGSEDKHLCNIKLNDNILEHLVKSNVDRIYFTNSNF